MQSKMKDRGGISLMENNGEGACWAGKAGEEISCLKTLGRDRRLVPVLQLERVGAFVSIFPGSKGEVSLWQCLSQPHPDTEDPKENVIGVCLSSFLVRGLFLRSLETWEGSGAAFGPRRFVFSSSVLLDCLGRWFLSPTGL